MKKLNLLDIAAWISTGAFVILTVLYSTNFPELLPFWRIALILSFALVGIRNYKNKNKNGLIMIVICFVLYVLMDWVFGVFK
ncbi:hypothetical protein DRW41_10940 [Neobacillus piezotolerans]|uniref:DUF5668 domain-containing protein n=1 Tax=Neobacillus piezotolerans TaxID=2259171 RepID=A0A3D8GRX7_9BACI|nr:hypothetical protein [Neobacillus piezotolerans]RDU37188.1 hypothetical protein DRW41_10940 [Neobacillus piezotolerans]